MVKVEIKKPYDSSITLTDGYAIIERFGMDSVIEYGPEKRQDISLDKIKSVSYKDADETDGYLKIISTDNQSVSVPFSDQSLNDDMNNISTILKKSIKPEPVETDSNNNESSEKVFCYKCGKKIDKNVVFCPYCGTEQNHPSSNKSPSITNNDNSIDDQEKINPNSSAWIALVAVGWVVFAVSIIPAFSWLQFVSFILGIVIQNAFPSHKGAGMAIWIASAAIFGISFMFGFLTAL
ncbi:zinc-ribbon domain-containing protein [Companilactobacillus nodensis]|uniref:Zinc-ribbon domain-containing protein n=1 Tax=Companilactobacillus nodensis DSM 19682 = JCM 14932 = NBRC 107160 TaxID=1423775 RepID=A0A0R1KBE8_9LACO|nr:zinc-ribbon domain-containing protein [Companilactobacillus nodensis]KRK78787.1 hypothetical protein FD03_GL002570 [Companilactobacillus nodensis DSM 19682 = JCM 14932 = NBRC 107160]